MRELQQEGRITDERGRSGDGRSQAPRTGRADASGEAVVRVDDRPDGLSPGLDAPLTHDWGDGWEDGLPRVTTDEPHRAERLRALGNAVVPAVAEMAWRTLTARVLAKI